MATSVTASILSFVTIMILNVLYERVAIWITDYGEFILYLHFYPLLSRIWFHPQTFYLRCNDRAPTDQDRVRKQLDAEDVPLSVRQLLLLLFLHCLCKRESCWSPWRSCLSPRKIPERGGTVSPSGIAATYIHLADLLYLTLLCLASAVWPWRLPHWVDHSTHCHHGRKSHLEQHPRGLATVSCQNPRALYYWMWNCVQRTTGVNNLAIFLASKSPTGNFFFICWHRWVKNLISRHCTQSTSEKETPRWEQDYRLQSISKLGLFYEYLEMGKTQKRKGLHSLFCFFNKLNIIIMEAFPITIYQAGIVTSCHGILTCADSSSLLHPSQSFSLASWPCSWPPSHLLQFWLWSIICLRFGSMLGKSPLSFGALCPRKPRTSEPGSPFSKALPFWPW